MHFRATSSIFALLASATPVLADVTPAEVWQSWTEYYKVSGYTVAEGARQETGDSLVLSDVVLTMDGQDSDVSLTIPQITLTGTGDGRVRTTTSDQSTARFVVKDAEDGDVNVTATLAHPGTEVISSGTAGDLTSETRMPNLTVTLDEVVTADETHSDLATLTVADLGIREHVVQGDPLKADFDVTSGRSELALNVAGKDDDGADYKVNGNIALNSLKSTGSGTFPANARMDENMAAALRAGMAFTANLQAGPLTASFDLAGTGEDGAPMTAAVKGDGQGFSADIGLSQAGLNYQVDSDRMTAEVTSSDMPFPVTYGMDSNSVLLQLPVSASDEPQPFKFTYSIAGLTLGDAIWDQFDQAKVLPRDPANLDIDVTGNLRVKQDVLDPEVMKAAEAAAEAGTDDAAPATEGAAPATDGTTPDAAAPDAATPDAPAPDAADATTPDATAPDAADATTPDAATPDATETEAAEAPEDPYEPVDIAINQFALSGAGVNVTAAGNLAAAGEGGMETPVGQINARAEGLNGLLDRLVQIGVVQQEQVGAARMMLAMFTKAGEGPDTLTMDIEFKEGGSIFANGQQVK